MLDITDLPPQIVPAVKAFTQRRGADIRAHRGASLEVHEQGVLDAWRAEAAPVLTGVVTAAQQAWIARHLHRGLRVRGVALVVLHSGGAAAALRRAWVARPANGSRRGPGAPIA